MHFFSVSNRKYCFDNKNFLCSRLDEASEAAFRIRNEGAKELSPVEVAKKMLQLGFSNDIVAEIEADLEEYSKLDECLPVNAKTPHRLRSITLHVSHSCNLGCSYCFAGKGDYGTSPKLMQKETAYNAIDFLVLQSAPTDKLAIIFFGGEPLLNKPLIWQIMAYTLEHYPDRDFSYSITTNGTLLDKATVEAFKDHGVSVLISMDGTGQKHDQSRPYKNGKGSFADIKSGVEQFQNTLPLGVRATITKNNCDLIADMTTFSEMGFRKAYFAPVSSFDEDIAIDEHSMVDIRQHLELLSDEYLSSIQMGKQPLFRGFDACIHVIKGRYTSSVGCGAGRRFVSVTPDGDYYPCHRFVGMPYYTMGSVSEGIDELRYRENWSEDVADRKDCSACWIRNFCGGGCSWETAEPTGKANECLYSTSCDYRRACYEIAFDLLSRLEGVADAVQ